MTAGGFWTRFLLPGGIWLLLLFAVPLVLVLALSFGYVDDLGRAVYSTKLDNYADSFNPTYLPVLLRSVLYALTTTVLCLVIGYPVAYYIARYGGRYRNVLIALLVLPFFVNYLVRTYAHGSRCWPTTGWSTRRSSTPACAARGSSSSTPPSRSSAASSTAI